MTTEPHVNHPRRRQGRRTSGVQEAQWQFQADLLDQLSDAVIAVDLDERITYLNRAAVAQYGVDSAGAIGQPLHHTYRNEWLQPEDELLADAALAQQGRWRGENRHIRRDGSMLHVEALVTVLHDGAGNATGLLATIRDITDRKQMERDLRASELRYRRLADTMPQLVWTADASGRTDYYNIHIHDFDPSVWQGTNGFDWQSLLHPDDLAPTLTTWQQAVRQRQPYSCEHRLHMADGSWRWHLSRAVLMQDPENGLRWFGTATDIHERKVAEEALRTHQERLQLGIQVAGLVIAEVDYATDLIHLDPAAATLYGLSPEVGAVPRATVHASFHPDDAPEIFRRMYASFDPAEPGWFAMEHRVIHPDGAIRWLNVRKQIFFAAADGTRRPIRAVLAAFDITEQKAVEEQLAFHAGLLDYTYDGVIATDADLNITAWNRGAEEAYGWRADEVRGRKPYEVLRSSMTPAARAEAVRQMAESGRFRVEATLHHRNGTALIAEGQTVALRNAAEQITGYITVNRDISERKAAEAALRASEERYRTLFERMEEGFCVFDLLYDEAGHPIDYRFLEVNPAFARFTGLENAVGKTAYELTPNLEPHWVAIYGEVARTGEARHFIEGSAAMARWFEVHAFRFGGPESRRVALLFTNITERKLTEDALRNSEAELRYTVELNPQVPWTADPAGNIISFNQRWLDLTGMSDEQALGSGWVETPHPDDRPAMIDAWTHSIQSGEPYDIEHRIRLADGGYRWMRSRAFPRRDQNGAIVRWYGATEDIHERKTAEEALRCATARFERAERAAHGFVFESDLLTGHVTRSPNFSGVTGYAQEEVPPTPEGWLALIHPADLPLGDDRSDLLSGSVTTYVGEYRIRHKAGHAIWLQEQGLIERDETGRALAIIGTTLDVTAQKAAAEAMRTSEAQLRQLADAMPQIVWQADAAGQNVYFNQRWLDYTGMTPAESLANANRALHPADQVEAVRHWEEVRPLGQPYEFELRLRRADGVYRWHLTRCEPVYNTEGQLLCWYGTSTDIHDRKEAELALRTSEERLRLATEAGGVGIFDHDLITNQTKISAVYAQITGLPLVETMPREAWLACVHPEDRSMIEAIWENARETGASYYYECRLIRPDGVLVWIEVNAWVTTNETGQGIRITGAVRDITERKQTALHQQFLLNLNSTLRTLHDAAAIQQVVVERLGQYLGVDRCRFNAIDLAADKATLLAAWSRPGLPPPGAVAPLSAHASAADIASAKAGRTLVVHNVGQDDGNATAKTLLLTRGYAATIRVPCLRAGQWVASLHVLQTTPRQWRADEVQLVENVVHHFWPLVEKARAEAERWRQAELLRRIADNVPGLIAYIGADERYRFVNRAYEEWFQRPRQHIVDHTILELVGEEIYQTSPYRQRALAGEQVIFEDTFLYPDGNHRAVWGRYQPDLAADGRVLGFYVFVMDITERQQAEADARCLADLAEVIRLARNAETLIADAVSLVGEHLQLGRCLWIEVDQAQDRGVVRYQHCHDQAPTAAEFPLSAASEAIRAALDAGLPLVIQDTAIDPRTADRHATLYAPRGVNALVNVPFLQEGVWRSLLSATVAAPRQWQAREIRLLETVAERIWLALEKLRAEEALRASEARFRAVQQATPDGYMIFESVRDEQGAIRDFRWLYLNPAGEQMVGRPAAELLGKCLLAEMPGNREEGLFDAYAKVVETGAVYQREFGYQHEGIDRWFRNTAAKAGDGFAVAFSDITARKQAEADQQLLADLAEQIRVAEDADELVAATVRLLGDHLQVGRCLWIEIDQTQQHGFIRAQHCRGLSPVPATYTQADYSPATRSELVAGRVLVNEDAQADPRTAARYETLYAPYQERAYVGVPFLREGMWRGILSVTVPKPRQWQPRELHLLTTVSERVWLALEKLWLNAEVRRINERFTLAEAAVPGWIYDYDWCTGSVMRSDGFNRILGYTPAECQPTTAWWQSLIHPDDWQWLAQEIGPLSLQGDRRSLEYRVRDRNGHYHHIWDRAQVFHDESGAIIRVVGSSVDISERKQAEEENRRLLAETQSLLAQVREGERFLQSIADTNPSVIYLFDLGTMSNRYANRQLAVTLGYTAAEAQALGDQFIPTLIHPDDQRYLADHLTHLAALTDGEMADWEYRMQHKGGEWRWLNSREIIFERDEQGRPAVILGALQDITARKEAEVALRASEARFRHLAEAMPQLVWTCQADGSLTYINQQWYAYSGIAPAVTLNEGMWPAIHPADEAANREQWRHALTSGAAYEGEVRLRRHDGCYRWFLERAIPVRDEADTIQQWFGVSMDVHDRKEAEIERKQAEETIRRQLAEIEAIYATAPVGLAVLDTELRYVRINTQLAQLNDLPVADHIGRTGHAIIPTVMATVEPLLRQVIATRQPLVDLEIVGSTQAAPNVERIWIESFYPLCNEEGAVIGINTMVQEITERKRQERHQQFLSELGMDLRLLSDTATIVTQVVKRLGDYLQVAGCRINEVDQQRGQFTLQKDWVAADAPWPTVATPGVYPLTELAPPTLLAALQAGQTVVVANTLHDPRTAPVVKNYENDQVHSLIGVPIFHQDEWRATLSVKGHGERQWRPDEVALLEAVASQLSALLEKVRAEEALRASEERLRLALAGGGMGIWESQIAANRSLWSPAEYALFGLAPGVEITNALFNTLVHPDDLPGLQTALATLIAAGNDHTGEFRIIRPDGAVRWLADRVTVIRDGAGQPVRLLGINFDITERKEREAMIRQQLAEIEAIYTTAPIGLCLVDRELRYVRINETLATINGSTIAGQLGRTLAETQPVEGYRIIEPLYRGVIATGIPLLNQELHESYVDPAQARDWLVNYYPLKNAEGMVTGVNAVILEITERKRHERQLKELNASLEERVQERTKALAQANRALSITNRELEQFTYAAAHDLRTPLRGIANLVQWISEDAAPVLPPTSQRHLDKLGGRVKRLEKLLEDMLAYSRVGRVRYQPETVDVQQLVQSLLDLLAPPTGFVAKASPQLPTFTALRVPLELVFRNLLSNTIRHHHDPARGHVEIAVRDLGAWYEFQVSDNGPGIDPQYHERIFGMFQTLKPRDQVEGSGIGLALVQKTLESVGGQVRMASTLGQGTTFYFTWPKE